MVSVFCSSAENNNSVCLSNYELVVSRATELFSAPKNKLNLMREIVFRELLACIGKREKIQSKSLLCFNVKKQENPDDGP